MAGKQKIVHGTAGFQLALCNFLEQIFQYVGQVANGFHAGHPGTTLEGMYVPLQFCCYQAVGRIFAPCVQRTACGVNQIVCFFEEDTDQFRIHMGKVGSALILFSFVSFLNIWHWEPDIIRC